MKIYKEKTEYESALEDCNRIIELQPDFKNIYFEKMELEKLQKEKFEKMKDEVVGNLKTMGNWVLGKFGMSTDNFKMQQNPDGTYGINFVQNT